MAYSKARRLSDSISATGEVSAFVDGSIVAADLNSTLDLTGKTITVANTSTGDSDTTVANTAFVQQEIAALVASAPGTLNTLNELAAALGDDASFSTTVTDSIATKLPLAGGTMTGALAMNTNAITSTGNLTLDVAGDIILDADGDDWKFNNAGTTTMEIKHESTSVDFYLSTTDDDFKFKGSDGGSTITALQLDMSEAGAATFNNSVDATNFKIAGAQGSDGQVLTSTGSGVAWESVDSVTKSNSAPSSPAAGDLWFNTSSSTASGIRAKGLAVYSGTAWELMNSLFSATGGTITTSGAYTIHTFTSSGTFTPNGANSVDWLVVAGGGGGGGNPSSDSGGGGGAGGFRTGTGLGVTATAYTVTIGAGGAGGAQQNGSAGNGAKGGNSVFGSISSTGGGFGGGPGHTNSGGPGGSGGGGGSGYNTGSTNGDPGAGNQGGYSPVEGYAGTATTYSYYWTAGAGGSASGQPTDYNPASGGGGGVANSYSGSSVTYAEGGDGQGGIVSVANKGNGGDGGGNAAANGRAGGSGIVIIRYLT